jgi:hypothetical protein
MRHGVFGCDCSRMSSAIYTSYVTEACFSNSTMLRASYLRRALLYTLLLGLSSGTRLNKIVQEYEYRSIQVPVSQFYDNVATADFDGNGAGYPVEYLPAGQLLSENIEVRYIPNYLPVVLTM